MPVLMYVPVILERGGSTAGLGHAAGAARKEAWFFSLSLTPKNKVHSLIPVAGGKETPTLLQKCQQVLPPPKVIGRERGHPTAPGLSNPQNWKG